MSEINEAQNAARCRESLLDRPAPEGYVQEWQVRLRTKPDDEVRDTVALLVFRISKEWLALRVAAVAEVTADAPVHRVPHRTNDVLRGIVNVRGELQLAFSLRAMLGLPMGEMGKNTSARIYPRMITLLRDGQRFVCRVDEVMGVSHFETALFEDAPVTVSKAMATFSRGLYPHKVGKVAVLDDELIFHSLLNQHL